MSSMLIASMLDVFSALLSLKGLIATVTKRNLQLDADVSDLPPGCQDV